MPDTADVQKTMKSMIELEGARVIFPTSFGYFDPHVLELARQYPQVTFVHCGGLWDEKIHPPNISSYFGYIDECQYLSGIVAGHTTRSKKLGFVAGKPIPQVLRNINAFTLGARSVDPSITCTVVFTGDWSLPVKEAEATNSLIDQGTDVITCHVNSPKVVVENTEKRGIWSCGYHCNQAALAPKGYLTGAEWGWQKTYTDYVRALKAGEAIPHFVRGGLKEGTVEDVAVRAGGLLRGQTGCGRCQSKVLGWFVRDFQGSSQGQYRQGGHSGGDHVRADRHRIGKYGLSGRGCPRPVRLHEGPLVSCLRLSGTYQKE